ncbi:hypothetical protein KGF57_000818 [Candida theae]|uniref:DUF2415 domain-containing protein n=1 Tax=Candida theae TaxID=1198502 RepID=A0AAD5G0E1_9ASCO|nr:uncharacterized protein KGF57_000818 [Candida theae]KAI5965025.1 hypothetical protein KGF57_000818 [Candida theae]
MANDGVLGLQKTPCDDGSLSTVPATEASTNVSSSSSSNTAASSRRNSTMKRRKRDSSGGSGGSNSSSQHFNRVSHQYNKCFQNYYHSSNFLKPNPIYIPNINTSVNHWQLRNLTKYNRVDNVLYHTREDSVHLYHLSQAFTKKVLKLNYFPRCFDNHEGLLATGGLLTSSSKLFSLDLDNLTSKDFSASSRAVAKGLFSFYNPELSILHTVKLGEMINNDVSLNKVGNQQYQALLCNNDANLYCVDINNNSSLKMTNKINCENYTCLNSSVKNPRNNLITAVGDSSSIFIIDPNSGSSPIVKTIDSQYDGGFGISYHPNGYLFSTVFQDGVCQLYDLRNLSSPMRQFNSTRKKHQSGAFRVCKISQQNDFNDLLIIAEHVGRVHLIDLKTFDRQVIVVPAALDQFANYKESLMKKQDTDQEDLKHMAADEFDEEKIEYKSPLNIYSENLAFTAPLVYDYDYLTNVNPRLFNDVSYAPPMNPPDLHSEALKLNLPDWSGNNLNFVSDFASQQDCPTSTASPRASFHQHPPPTSTNYRRFSSHPPPHLPSSSTSTSRPSVSYDVDIDSQLNEIYLNHNPSNSRRNTTTTAATAASAGTSPLISSATPLSTSSSYMYSTYCDDSYQQHTNHQHGEMELSGIEFVNDPVTGELKIVVGCQDAGVLMWDVNAVTRRSIGSFDFV